MANYDEANPLVRILPCKGDRGVNTGATVVTSASDMTDTTKAYLYAGTTGGNYTKGHWYYWDGTEWKDGGEYTLAVLETEVDPESANAVQSQAIAAALEALEAQIPTIDATLAIEGAGADAKATGERIAEAQADLNGISSLPKLPRIIGSDGKWTDTSTTHISVEMEGGETVAITAKQSAPAVCAFLKSDNAAHNTAADFCSGSEWATRKKINAGSTATYIAPSDCRVLYFAVFTNNQDIFPEKVVINGEDVTLNVRKTIVENTEAISALDNREDAVEADISGLQTTLDITGLRKTLKGEYTQVTLPEYAHLSGYDLPLFTDGNKYVHGIDLRQYKNSSTHTVTVKNSSELSSALANATPGDTIILDGGFYGPVTITKSINLIGRNRPLFTNYVLNAFDTTNATGVYRVSAYSFSHSEIYDITNIDKGVVLPLTAVPNITSCINNAGTYFVDTYNRLNLHLFGGNDPLGNVAVVKGNQNIIGLDGSQASCKWYLEGLTVVGGKSCIYAIDSESYLTQTLIGVDCKTYYAQTNNNIFMRGVNALFQRCLAAGAYLDGISYHEPSTRDGDVANGFEVDCIAHDNGSRDTGSHPDGVSNNGSTIHDGGKIVRINGLYYNNNGGNVADASPNTESYNYGCIAFDSKAPYDTKNETSADFWSNRAVLYLYGCRSLGDSQYSLRTDAGTEDYPNLHGNIYVDGDTEYDANKTAGFIHELNA